MPAARPHARGVAEICAMVEGAAAPMRQPREAVVPFFWSTAGYGLLWDNYAWTAALRVWRAVVVCRSALLAIGRWSEE